MPSWSAASTGLNSNFSMIIFLWWWSGLGLPDVGWCCLRPGRQGHFVSCGFAALSLDRQAGDQGMAGGRGRREEWSDHGGRLVAERLSPARDALMAAFLAVSYWARQRCRSAIEARRTAA